MTNLAFSHIIKAAVAAVSGYVFVYFVHLVCVVKGYLNYGQKLKLVEIVSGHISDTFEDRPIFYYYLLFKIKT